MDSNDNIDNPLHVALLQRLVAAHTDHADPRAGRILEAMLDDAIGLVADGNDVADLKLLAAVVSELRRAMSVFRPYPHQRKVTAFGSARTQPLEPVYEMAVEFGRQIAKAGFMVITGGGPGIMSAVVEGAGAERSFGVGIRLPFEQESAGVLRGDPKLIEFKYFFTRKLFFLKEASAVVLFPGGLGTHDEGFETLTLVQTGKSRLVPIVCLDVPGSTYWQDWNEYLQGDLLPRGLISDYDANLYRITDSVEEAVAEIQRFYSVYHSSRTIRGRTVVRLQRPLDEKVLAVLSSEFADILGGKPVRTTRAMKEEADEPWTTDLPRIVLDFDQRRFGRLRKLIDRLNELGTEPA